MKTTVVRSFMTFSVLVLLAGLTEGCAKKDMTSSISTIAANTISGVAASGAPISNGAIDIKGSSTDEASVSTTTAADGSYSADVTSLSGPYLIRVTAPSGEKYISVASKKDLAEGKEINVTPLTHTIVSKVFQNADADDLFTHFKDRKDLFTEEKLTTEKETLLRKFIDAGLLGSGKVAGDDVDLMNGHLQAGTSIGVDGLLDVIDVNTGTTAGVEIKLKGGAAPLFSNRLDGSDDHTAITPISNLELSATSSQLDVLGKIKTRLNDLAALISSKTSCNNQTPATAEGDCSLNSLHSIFAPFFHTDYKGDGYSKDSGIWGLFCKTSDGNKDAKTSDACDSYLFENISLKDITLIRTEENVAFIIFNFYVNGLLKGTDEMTLKLEGDVYNLFGNKKSFQYWIDTQSIFDTAYNKTNNTSIDTYSVNLNFNYESKGSHIFDGSEVFTLTAASGHHIFQGDSNQMNLYLIKSAKYNNAGTCTGSGFTFSTVLKPYSVYNPSTGVNTYKSFAEACTSGDACVCASHGYLNIDYNISQRVTLTQTMITNMDKIEKINFTATGVSDSFNIKKPMVLNPNNVAQYAPSFGKTVAAFCSDTSFLTKLNLQVQNGNLNFVSLNQNYRLLDNSWGNQNAIQNYGGSSYSSVVFEPTFETSIPAEAIVQQTYLYLSANDNFDRQFVRQVSCSSN